MTPNYSFPFLLISYSAIFIFTDPVYIYLPSVYAVTQLFQDSQMKIVLEDNTDLLGYTAYFLKDLKNLITNFEYTFDVSGDQIFPNDTIKQTIVSKYEPSIFVINNLSHQLFGFNITASDITIHVSPKRIDITKTMVNIPSLLARDVRINDGTGLINLSYNQVDLGSVYGVYDKNKDRMTVHVPINVAAMYIQ
jgi:hypothetical protein